MARKIIVEVPTVPMATVIGPLRTGSWRSIKPVFNHDLCTGCGLCATYCPEGVVKKTPEGCYVPEYDYCKGCGVCANECPSGAIEMVKEE